MSADLSISFSFVYFNSSYTKKDLGYNYTPVSTQLAADSLFGAFEKDDLTSVDWIVVLNESKL